MGGVFSTINDPDLMEGESSEAQALLPVQFYAARRGTSEIEPLRRLMTAMLVDAVRCFQAKFESRQPATRQEFAEARSWIFSDQDDGAFSFRAVCEALEVDAGAVRKGLARWEQNRLAGGKPRLIRRSAVPAKQRILHN
jgi:hypothetical protein